ncbi:YheC/YheD family endospore coat-associated protein [Bacillus massilinigeriensis]|uniref:YheC/YheD family endospore coat-associated protein n=1 Tax=Bacillus mediterraneensis TaxID=1805474 RepID=UPI0008F8AB92|nr:YheC/YheD family protein [Bacillus mediterraneensis]
MKKRYRLETNDLAKSKVYCPRVLLTEKARRISFGNRVVDTAILPYDGTRIMIGNDIANQLNYPSGIMQLYSFLDKGTLYIGPLIGVLTSGFTPFPTRPVGERSSFFYKLLSSSREAGVFAFVFGKEHIDWEQGTINCYTIINSEWTRMEVPFPNVIYDRLPNRKAEKDTVHKDLKRRFETDYLIPFYNPGFFSKMEVYERLFQEQSAAAFLPETHPFSSFALMERMLSSYGHIYVKPMNGSLGNGIRQIIYNKQDGTYCCRFRNESDGKNKLLKFDSLESLCEKVFNGRTLPRMLVQQGISMLRRENRLIDFRVHTNKDGEGKWVVAAIAAKIGGLGSPTTHVNNGGEVKPLGELFELEDERRKHEEALSHAALTLSKALERNMEGFIGEIGFDFGIDKEGKVWMFEANSKPGRSIFKNPALKEFDILTRRLSLLYGIYLAEKAILHPEELFQ